MKVPITPPSVLLQRLDHVPLSRKPGLFNSFSRNRTTSLRPLRSSSAINPIFSKINERQFSLSPTTQSTKILTSITTPPIFHDYLRLVGSNNTLLLILFTSSTSSRSISQISSMLQSLIPSRFPKTTDRFSGLVYTEADLDSPDTSNGPMSDLAVEWGISQIPTLIGFGGRRAERVTDRITDESRLLDRKWVEGWVDEEMAKGDPFGVGGGSGGKDVASGGGSGKGILGRLFGS